MKKYYISISILLVMIIVAISILYYQDEKMNEVKSDMGSRMIASNIIQLEGAIMFQIQNNWNEPNNVNEKVEDVIEGLYMTRSVADRFNKLSSEDDEILMRLIRYFEKFPSYSGFPNYSIDEKEIKAYVKLREDLRDVGWGMNISYSSSWHELIEKANKLMSM
ncbi:hypothetical protein [Paenibacillus xylanexedens]|uniref:hypothetical protein n=1 Tax=Paenibacillus xylanexedens TaxID=528191 RepID=UPI000F5236DA|nr:hypothetical protein [Paenibacillus xylanexedens]